eukprot:5229922-Alexandrium_andersonii.AAC.1
MIWATGSGTLNRCSEWQRSNGRSNIGHCHDICDCKTQSPTINGHFCHKEPQSRSGAVEVHLVQSQHVDQLELEVLR